MRADAVDPGVYDAAYYAHYGGEVYERSERWLSFFGGIADRIIAELSPTTALDVGCAYGLLVETLRDRGVEARGFDISEHAISGVREDVRPHCWVGSVLEPIQGRYDVITCVEVIEHLHEREAAAAVTNICAATGDVLFTSTPFDYREETHVNVRPPEYWAEMFARHGFVHDLDFDGTFLAPWAMRFRRTDEPMHRILAGFEREFWRLRHENTERNALVIDQMRRINELRSQVEALEAELRSARAAELQLSDRLPALEREIEILRRDAAVIERLRRMAHQVPLGAPTARRLAAWLRRSR